MALGAVLFAAPRVVGWIERALAAALSGNLLLVLPPVAFAAYRLVLLPRFPSTHALFGDWYNHALFATVFLLGFLLARVETFWGAIERQRWVALSAAGLFYLSFVSLRGMPLSPALKIYAGIAYGSYQWLCMAAVVGFACRWLTTDSGVRRYLTDAMFPYYIVHQTAIIVIAYELRGRDIPAWAEASLVIGGTAAVCIVTYEIVRRISFLRPLFGLRMAASGPTLAVQTSSQPAQ